jgi:quinol monooxygenase YgiN
MRSARGVATGVTITIDMVVRLELTEQVCAGIPAMFTDTRRFAGFRSIRVVRHKDEPNRLIVIESWDREADYQAYLDWRTESGEMAAALPALLSMRTDMWIEEIGSATADAAKAPGG